LTNPYFSVFLTNFGEVQARPLGLMALLTKLRKMAPRSKASLNRGAGRDSTNADSPSCSRNLVQVANFLQQGSDSHRH
jgi:hypothetical protein